MPTPILFIAFYKGMFTNATVPHSLVFCFNRMKEHSHKLQ